MLAADQGAAAAGPGRPISDLESRDVQVRDRHRSPEVRAAEQGDLLGEGQLVQQLVDVACHGAAVARLFTH